MFIKQIKRRLQGVREMFSIPPTLYNICIDDLVRNWKHLANPGIKISGVRYLNVLLFGDDLRVIQIQNVFYKIGS